MTRLLAALLAAAPLAACGDEPTPPAVATGRIVFASDRGGNYDIWVVHPDGSGLAQLTSGPDVDLAPALSPDGTKIAFARTVVGLAQIWVMDADGSNARALTADPNVEHGAPAWSPDGQRIALTEITAIGDVRRMEIYAIRADGAGGPAQRLTTNDSFDGQPAWSPDGRTIAFVSDRGGSNQLWTMRAADGTGQTRVAHDSILAVSGPKWAPTGSELVFAGRVGTAPGVAGIHVVGADGANLRTLVGLFGAASPSWSADGAFVAFSSPWPRDGGVGTQNEIVVVRAGGTDLHRLTTQSSSDIAPAWGR